MQTCGETQGWMPSLHPIYSVKALTETHCLTR